MSSVEVDIETQLKRLGKLRREQRKRDVELVELIRDAVVTARDGGVSMSKVAEILGIDRTQLYRTYLR